MSRTTPGAEVAADDLGVVGRAEDELDLRPAAASSVVRTIAREGHYEPHVIDVLDFLCSSSSKTLFVDVGSNIGYISLAILARARRKGSPGPAVVAYEPSSSNRLTAERLMDANSLPYEIRAEALSEHPGQAIFHLSSRSDSSNSLLPEFRPSRGTETVTVSTVDAELEDLWDKFRPHRLVVKIDVEGAEAMVLSGARRTLAEKRPVLVFEVLPGRGEAQIASILREFAYTLFRPSSAGWIECHTLFGDESYRDRDWIALPSELVALSDGFLARPDPDRHSPRIRSRLGIEVDRSLGAWVEIVLEKSSSLSRDLAASRGRLAEQALELESQRRATEDMTARALTAEARMEQELESLREECDRLRGGVEDLHEQKLMAEETARARTEEAARKELELRNVLQVNSLHVRMLHQVFNSRSWRWTRWLRRQGPQRPGGPSSAALGTEQAEA